MTALPEPVRIEVAVPASFEAVWRAFREPAEIRRWHGWDYDGLDDEIRTIYLEETTASEHDRAIEIGGHLFSLDDSDGEVVLRVTRTPGAGGGWAEYYDELEEGWLSFLQQLRFALSRQPGEDRRTVRLEGRSRTADPPDDFDDLGLAAVASLEPGRRYEVGTAWGAELTGETWFRSAHQLGLTVDGWGEGLFIVTRSPDTAGAGTAMTATTYGFDDQGVDDLRQRIGGWWDEHFGQE